MLPPPPVAFRAKSGHAPSAAAAGTALSGSATTPSAAAAAAEQRAGAVEPSASSAAEATVDNASCVQKLEKKHLAGKYLGEGEEEEEEEEEKKTKTQEGETHEVKEEGGKKEGKEEGKALTVPSTSPSESVQENDGEDGNADTRSDSKEVAVSKQDLPKQSSNASTAANGRKTPSFNAGDHSVKDSPPRRTSQRERFRL